MVAVLRTQYWRRYLSYLVVGGVVGVITVAIRELVALALRVDTPFTYAVSILLAYACGIVLSFVWQARYTFRQQGQPHLRGRFSLFAVMAVASAFLTVALSRLIRYGLGFDQIFGVVGPGLAFAVATLLVSIVSYVLNARFIFTAGARAATPRE